VLAMPQEIIDVWLQRIPSGRLVTTEEIAEAVALLVSDRGKFIGGVIYRVDGGMTGA
jgi:NAD(P)-dependent dehydrogenase (short-subunit alcohol dehydrogenase family)